MKPSCIWYFGIGVIWNRCKFSDSRFYTFLENNIKSNFTLNCQLRHKLWNRKMLLYLMDWPLFNFHCFYFSRLPKNRFLHFWGWGADVTIWVIWLYRFRSSSRNNWKKLKNLCKKEITSQLTHISGKCKKNPTNQPINQTHQKPREAVEKIASSQSSVLLLYL